MRVTVTAQLYGQFLVSSQVNYTGPYLADHLDGLTHDNGRYFLKTQRFAPRHGRCRTGKQRPLDD